jgi:enterobactin synthetase component D
VRTDRFESPHGRCAIVECSDGRVALRSLGIDLEIGVTDRGAPAMPAGWVGSISHKGERAAAIVAAAGDGHVGIDLEHAIAPRLDIGRRILTPREHRATGRELTRVFAIKEAIYKAIDPIVRRYVGFTEVELAIGDDGTCAVTVVDVARLPVAIDAWWCERDGFWLATSRARRA